MTAPTLASYTHQGRTIDQWRVYCQAKLDGQMTRVKRYSSYYDGEFPMLRQVISNEDRRVFLRLLRECGANWCELIVNAVAERLAVVGFRFGGPSADPHAWLIWQANQIDADSEMAQTDALVCGHSYVSVQPDDSSPVGVTIVGEHPTETTVVYEPGSRRRRAAAYKSYVDPVDQSANAVLELPDVIVFWRKSTMNNTWGDPYDVTPNPLGAVSVVELRPAPRTVGCPRSELHSALVFQDRINTTIFNRLVATDYGAFRQVWATGVTLDKNPDGTARKPFNVGANRLLTNENPAGAFGMFAESTLAGYLGAVAADVQHLAAITQTPPHYLLGGIVNASGDALKAAETGLVAKVRRRAAHLGEGWGEVMRLAFTVLGDAKAADVTSEVIWRDFESRSEGETVDALVKMATLEVPREVLWQRWGASPPEVDRWREMLAKQQAENPVPDVPVPAQPIGGNAA